jgi:hypothetical protein
MAGGSPLKRRPARKEARLLETRGASHKRPEGRFFGHSEGYPQVAEIRFAKCRLLYRREADVRRSATIGLPSGPAPFLRNKKVKRQPGKTDPALCDPVSVSPPIANPVWPGSERPGFARSWGVNMAWPDRNALQPRRRHHETFGKWKAPAHRSHPRAVGGDSRRRSRTSQPALSA